MVGNLRYISLLVVALASLGSCSPARTCAGEECSCSSDEGCIIGCSSDPVLHGCDCTNGWPVRRQSHEGEEDCGGMACEAAMCADWTEYEARCSFGRCIGVPVEDHP